MEILFTLFGFIFGASLGSFVKVLADRSLSKKTFAGRSICPHCKHQLAWYDLIPVFSYVQLLGSCRYCHKKLEFEYLGVELVLGLIVGYLFYQYAILISPLHDQFRIAILGFELFFKTFIVTVLLSLTITDFKKMFIPDRIIIPSIVIAFVCQIILTGLKVTLLYLSLNATLVGKYLLPPHSDYFYRHALFDNGGILAFSGLLGSIIMALVLGLFFLSLIVVTKGRGMGGGDLKMGVFIGLILAFPLSLLALMLSFLLGSIFGVSLLILKKKHFGQTIPFGPFLALGTLITLLWGPEVLNWYLEFGF